MGETMMLAWSKPAFRSIQWDGLRNGRSARLLLFEGCKRCPRCQEIKLLSDFTMRDDRYAVSRCKECMSALYYEDVVNIREANRQRRLGVPPGTYDLLISEFGAHCGICGTGDPGGKGAENNQFCIDHDHDTGVVRGLLCTQCNVGIGMLRHSSDLLYKAISYLNRMGHTVEELQSRLDSKNPPPAELPDL